ncbi:MAG: glycosyltransferase [Pseudomonadota bacterium]
MSSDTQKPSLDCSEDVYISWINFQRRALSMQQVLGFELHFIPPPFASKWLKPLGYIWQTGLTAKHIFAKRPKRVWLQSPPTFLPHLILAMRVFRRFGVVADTHHQAVIPPWSKLPGALSMLNRCDTVMVHNAETLEEAARLGVDRKRLMLVEDPPPANMGQAAPVDPDVQPYVLVPCSFKSDEPIDTLLEAAADLPELQFRLTGNRARAAAQGYTDRAPQNVIFTDFVPLEEYDRMLQEAAIVLGLTIEEGIQLSVANEALGAGRPLVLSETRILRAMFGDAAVFGANTRDGIAGALRFALQNSDELAGRSHALGEKRLAEWKLGIAELQP